MRPLAWLGARLFSAAVWLRGRAYDRGLLPVTHAAAPVISVGNLEVGGTGKTPVVALLAERLLALGHRPAVLSRGYGGSNDRRFAGPRVVSRGQGAELPAEVAGDEPVLLGRRPGLRVVVCPDRARAARVAVEELGASVLLLDDGFQHRRLARDLEVVVLDGARPLAGGALLPLGRWREPPAALARAQLVVLNLGLEAAAAAPLLAELTRLAPDRPQVWVRVAARPVRSLRGAAVGLLAGIARPERFRRTVESLGAQVVHQQFLPDHAPLDRPALQAALARARAAGAERVLVTEKDLVRWPIGQDDPIEPLPIRLEVVAGEPALAAALGALPGGTP